MSTKTLLADLFRPLLLLSMSAFFLPITTFNLLLSANFGALLSPASFKQHWFARFWQYFGPLSQDGAYESVAPLLHQAYGVVLDVGPGAGHWFSLYDKTKVTKIYAVEPNVGHHRGLRQKAREAGLEDRLELMGAMVGELEGVGVRRGSVDTVVTIQVLCSVEQQRELAGDLYGFLREGGQWVVFEHVRARGNRVVVGWQALVNWIWPTFFGGCSLQRDTAEVIRGCGRWSRDGLGKAKRDSETSVIPSVEGVLVK